MDDDALIEVVSAAAARGIESLDLQPWAEVMLYPYESLSPLAFGRPAGAGPDEELDDEWTELGFLPDPDNTAFRAVQTRVDSGGEDGYELLVSFYWALASRLHAITGLPVFIHGWDTYEEQLARLAGGPAAGTDSLRELDVLVSLRVDDGRRVAVVYRDPGGQVWSTRSYGLVDPEPGLGRWADLGSRPAVLAGALAVGAATAEVRVGGGPWVEPDQTNRGFWICALDKRELTRTPDLVYRDAEGVEFAVDVPFDRPGLPALWPTQAPSPGRLVAHGATNILEQDNWQVEISDFRPVPPDWPADLIAEQLRVDAARVASRPIAGSVLGRRHGFELAADGGVWIAVADCGGFAVTIRGTGGPPPRLDLETAS